MELENLKWWQIALIAIGFILLFAVGACLDLLTWYVRVSFLKWMFN